MNIDYYGGAIILAAVASLFILAKGQTDKWILLIMAIMVAIVFLSAPVSK